MEQQDYFNRIDYDKLVPCGRVLSGTVTLNKRNCFSFKSMRSSNGDIIISKDEWVKFLKFIGATETDKPCEQY